MKVREETHDEVRNGIEGDEDDSDDYDDQVLRSATLTAKRP